MRKIDLIVLHCTATREGQDIGRAEVDAMHRARGWRGIGYHHVVRLDGRVEAGRPEADVGAHVEGFNARSIGVVYVGGLDAKGKAKDTRTPEQHAALERLVGDLKRRYPGARIVGHRDLSPDLDRDGKVEPHEWLKQCPCFDAPAWAKGLGL